MREFLTLAETKDVRFFYNLSRELSLAEDSTHYEFARFLSATPGWMAADQTTRGRIVEVARRFLLADTDAPETCRTAPANSIFQGHMAAVWLLLESDRRWVEALPLAWWERWAWYLLREVQPHMHGEPKEPKVEIVRLLQDRAPLAVAGVAADLASGSAPDAHALLRSVLEVLGPAETPQTELRLCQALEANAVPPDRVGPVAEFVLARSPDQALTLSMRLVDPHATGSAQETAVRVALVFRHTSIE